MTSWIDAISKRRKAGVKPVEIVFDDSTDAISIPLRYPKSIDKANAIDIIDRINKMDTAKTNTKTILEHNDELMLTIVKGCIDGDCPTDDDLLFLLNQAGGFDSAIVKKCQRLMGLGAMIDDDKPTDRSAHRTKKSRGR